VVVRRIFRPAVHKSRVTEYWSTKSADVTATTMFWNHPAQHPAVMSLRQVLMPAALRQVLMPAVISLRQDLKVI